MRFMSTVHKEILEMRPPAVGVESEGNGGTGPPARRPTPPVVVTLPAVMTSLALASPLVVGTSPVVETQETKTNTKT